MIILKILTNKYLWLLIILLIGFKVRLYKIDSPIADWHSWRQADTAAVTRNFIKMGFNPLFPYFDDMSHISDYPASNLNRFRFVEFPIYNIAVYPFYVLFGVNETYHRLVSIIFSLGSIVFIYLIAESYLGVAIGLTSAAIFSLLPFSIFFSRTTLPEPTFLFFTLGMMYFVDKWIWKSKNIWGVLGFIFTAIAFLIKPWAIFFFIPLIYSLFNKERKIIPSLKYFIFFILAITPFILWRLWILQQPEGIPASNWLTNGDGIRFRPAFFWWIISERIGREILGATGFVLFSIGILLRDKKSYFLHVWFLSMCLYFTIFATGNVRHNYYQYIFVPIASIFFAKGFITLIKGQQNLLPRIWTIIFAIVFLPLAFYFSWMQVKGFYQINNPVIVEAGKEADKLLPKNAIVVAPYNGDTAFLYQTNRPGFPVVPTSIKSLIADYGVTHYISTTKDAQAAWIIRHFLVLEDNPKFIIADLTKLTKPFDDTLDPQP